MKRRYIHNRDPWDYSKERVYQSPLALNPSSTVVYEVSVSLTSSLVAAFSDGILTDPYGHSRNWPLLQ